MHIRCILDTDIRCVEFFFTNDLLRKMTLYIILVDMKYTRLDKYDETRGGNTHADHLHFTNYLSYIG